MRARKAQKLKPVTAEARNLFSRPLQPSELARFDAAILDPPRAGAASQAAALANSAPSKALPTFPAIRDTFARDAGYPGRQAASIARVKPVDQFLWSSHIELVALLERR